MIYELEELTPKLSDYILKDDFENIIILVKRFNELYFLFQYDSKLKNYAQRNYEIFEDLSKFYYNQSFQYALLNTINIANKEYLLWKFNFIDSN